MRLSFITHHSLVNQSMCNLVHIDVLSKFQRELASSFLRVGWGDHFHLIGVQVEGYQVLEVACHQQGFGSEPFNTSFFKNFQTGQQRGNTHNRRIRETETKSTWDRVEHFLVHLESSAEFMSPPPSKARASGLCMVVVHKAPSNTTWAGVEVLVRAPAGKVNVPVMQLEREIANSMGQIEPNDAPLLVACFGNGCHVKILPSVVLNSRQQHKGYLRSFRFDNFQDVFYSKDRFSCARLELN
mmetsp:Transcript_10544/g.14434  ORF Transcript_10544/g.14434 Transcript_10544/m.14434 type:complete len:241 (+) Transcript_10544:145-867(+)